MRDHIVFVDSNGNVQLLQQPIEIDDGGGSVGLGNEGGGGSGGGSVIEPLLKVKTTNNNGIPFEPSPCPAKHVRALDGTCQPIEGGGVITPVLLPNGNTDFLGTAKQFASDNPMIALAVAGLVVYSLIKS